MRNHIIFDLDGTLADTAPDLLFTLNQIIEPRGLQPVSIENIGKFIGHGAKAMIAKAYAFNQTALDDNLHDDLLSEFLNVYMDHLAVKTHLFPNLSTAMDQLEGQGFDFSVCTNKRIDMAMPLLTQLDIIDRFKSVTGGNSFEFRKPDPRHLEETVKIAGKKLSDAIMIGDSATDINAAINASIPSVVVTFGYSDEPVENLGANRIINNFCELPEAIADLRSF